MAAYTIRSLEELNLIDERRLSSLERIAFSLPSNWQFNAACEYAVDEIKKVKTEEKYAAIGGFCLGISSLILCSIAISVPIGLIIGFLNTVPGLCIGSNYGRMKDQIEAYKQFLKLRERINHAYKNLEGVPYRSYPILADGGKK